MSSASGFGRGQSSRKPMSKYELGHPGMALHVKNIAVPDKMKCMTCEMIRDKAFYSEKQLNALRWRINTGWVATPTSKNNVKCKQCTGCQPHELLCSTCGEVKTKATGFAKAQRHNPDNARCIECVILHGDTECGLPMDCSDGDDDDDDIIPYIPRSCADTTSSTTMSTTDVGTESIAGSVAELEIDTKSTMSLLSSGSTTATVGLGAQDGDGFTWTAVGGKKDKGKGRITEPVGEAGHVNVKETVTEAYGTIRRKTGPISKVYNAKDVASGMNLFDADGE